MSAKFLHPSGTAPKAAQAEALRGEGGTQPSGPHAIDWRSARLAGHSCCCPAKPAVIAIMPPTAGRPYPTELLLCGHHYRASRRKLDLAGARILDLAGSPLAGDVWSVGAGAR